MKKISKKVDFLYQRVKTQLLLQAPFFGSLLLQRRWHWTDNIPTAATDGVDIFFNPAFAEELTEKQMVGVVVHELCHIMYMHPIRRGDRDPKAFNVAADYALNPTVVDCGFDLPEGALLSDEYKNMTAEAIYNKLPKDPNGGGGFQPFGGVWSAGNDDDENHLLPPPQMTKEEQQSHEREVNIQVASAAQTAKAAGRLPDSIARLVDDNAKSKVDWKEKLWEFLQEGGADDYTFRRPDRRMMAHDLYLPSEEGKTAPPFCIIFDTSGSIYSSDKELEQFTAEIRMIKETVNPEYIHILYVDTQVESHDEFSRDEELEFNLKGGGGTDFTSAFQYIQDIYDYAPEALIVFTDMYISGLDNLEHPGMPVQWVSYDTNDIEPPFGTKLDIGE